MEKKFCDQCRNQCPVDSLRCNRGRRAFGMELIDEGKQRSHQEEDQKGVIGLLRQCGHLLHHGKADAADFLSKLTQEEQEVLEKLLKKLMD